MVPPTRRALLHGAAGLTTALAGCSGLLDGSAESTRTVPRDGSDGGPGSGSVGRRPPVVAGMFIAGIGVLATVLVQGYWPWIVTAGVTGVGMALLYPNLITVVGDAAHPAWRATGLGVYRMWRDAATASGRSSLA